MPRRPLPAARVYLFYSAAWALLFSLAFTLSLVYQVQDAHLNPLELVLIGTVLEVSCFVGEVPTGVVADLYSRRLSVIIGLVLMGIGVILYGALPSFWPLVAAQVVWGVGYTFISGAAEAWITDEVGEDAVQPVFTRAHQLGLAFGVAGTVLAGAIGLLGLGLPTVVGGAGFVVLGLVLVVVMPEDGFAPTPRGERTTWSHLRDTLVSGLRAARVSGVVRSLLVVTLLAGLASEVFDRLWTQRILTDFALPTAHGLSGPAIWFTVFALAGSLVALAASLVANRLASAQVNADHPNRLLAGLVGIQVLGVAGFALSGQLWLALACLWVREAAATVAGPIQQAWLNRNVDSRTRATTLSVVSQADAVGQVLGGPPLGALATRASVPVALLVAAAIQAPATWVLWRTRGAEQV